MVKTGTHIDGRVHDSRLQYWHSLAVEKKSQTMRYRVLPESFPQFLGVPYV